MQTTLVATATTKSQRRIAGTYQAAWRVTIGDATGLVVHSFEYDGRSIENEEVWAEPSIADAMKNEIDPECWDPAEDGFCDDGTYISDDAAMESAREAATVQIYTTP